MLKVFLLMTALASPLAAQAEIITCPLNGRPYDTSHGYYVDVPGTSQFVSPSRRPSSVRQNDRPSRSTYTAPSRSTYTTPRRLGFSSF